jgi:two-component system KDP operon response regulator KdpE
LSVASFMVGRFMVQVHQVFGVGQRRRGAAPERNDDAGAAPGRAFRADAAAVRLDDGADDYLTKPFGTAELLARARAALRRQQQGRAARDHDSIVRFGAVAIDLQAHAVTRDGHGVRLAPTEYRLLAALARNAGRVVSNPQLLRDVWGQRPGEGAANNAHYLRIYMGHLRRKLEDDPAQPKYLITETGVGYRLAVPI